MMTKAEERKLISVGLTLVRGYTQCWEMKI